MKGMSYEVVGKKLVITVEDIDADFGPSTSGKTTIIASSEGNMKVGDVSVGLNVYKPRKR